MGGAPAAAASGSPQARQNRVPGSTEYPHAGHQEPPIPTTVPLPGMQKQANPPRQRLQLNGTTDGTADATSPFGRKFSRLIAVSMPHWQNAGVSVWQYARET